MDVSAAFIHKLQQQEKKVNEDEIFGELMAVVGMANETIVSEIEKQQSGGNQ